MNVKKIVLLNIIISVFLVISSILINNYFFTKKIVFIKLNDVYEKFELTSILGKKAEKTVNIKKNILDSLKVQLEMTYRNLQSRNGIEKITKEELQQFNFLKEGYASRKENFEKTNDDMIKSYEEQIWTQINNFIRDFGKEKNYDLVLGANGSGSVMYSNGAIDVTSEAIEYVNSKYVGN